jgi:hypothetical protein
MNPLLSETVQLPQPLSARAADPAGALPSLDLQPAELARLAGEVERVAGRLASVEERLGALGPVGISREVDKVLAGLRPGPRPAE